MRLSGDLKGEVAHRVACFRQTHIPFVISIVFNFARIQFDDSISHSIISVVMADYDYCLPSRSKAWQHRAIKHFFELWVLIRRPFIEDVNMPVFQICDEQCETFALAL